MRLLLILILLPFLSMAQGYEFSEVKASKLEDLNREIFNGINITEKASLDTRKALKKWIKKRYTNNVFYYLDPTYEAYLYILTYEESELDVLEAIYKHDVYNYRYTKSMGDVIINSIECGVAYVNIIEKDGKEFGVVLMIYK